MGQGTETSVNEIGLGEVVRALRAELEGAMAEGEGKEIMFEPTAIDLEFHVGVSKTKEGRAGIRFWVLDLGGEASYDSERIQTVKLSLTPVLAGGGRIRITHGTNTNPLEDESKSRNE